MSHPFAKATTKAGGESQSRAPLEASSLTRPAPIERRFQRIYDIGCIACARYGWVNPCQVHHLNLGQHAGAPRLGDHFTIGLCPWHHQGQPIAGASEALCKALFGPSMAHEPVRFREVFGTDRQLLEYQDYRIIRAERLKVTSHEIRKP